ncbi:MAG: hypothetical protein QW478_09465 [Candidatus Micrarchaeaceae archaeon]
MKFTMDDYYAGKVSMKDIVADFFTNLSKSSLIPDNQTSQIEQQVQQGDSSDIFVIAYEMIELLFDSYPTHHPHKKTSINENNKGDQWVWAEEAANRYLAIGNTYWGNFTDVDTIHNMLQSDNLANDMQIPMVKDAYQRWMGAIGWGLVFHGIYDLAQILFWVIIAGFLGAVAEWVASLGLPGWLVSLVTAAINWLQGQTQQKITQYTYDLTGVVNALTSSNNVLEQIAGNILAWAGQNAQALGPVIQAKITDAITAWQQQQASLQADSVNTSNEIQVAHINHLDQMSRQLSIQLGVNQQAVLDTIKANNNRLVVYY